MCVQAPDIDPLMLLPSLIYSRNHYPAPARSWALGLRDATETLTLLGWNRWAHGAETENKRTDTFCEIAKCQQQCRHRKRQSAKIETENDRPVLPSLGWVVGGEGQEEVIPGRRKRTEPSMCADSMAGAERREQREGRNEIGPTAAPKLGCVLAARARVQVHGFLSNHGGD